MELLVEVDWEVVEEVTHRAAVLCDRVAESGVPLGSELLTVGALQDQGLLQAAASVPVGHAVLAVISDVLSGLARQQLQ